MRGVHAATLTWRPASSVAPDGTPETPCITDRNSKALLVPAKLAAVVPLPRVHLVRYAGCLAPHSQLRGAIILTPRQQGGDGREASVGTPCWSWARLLKRVFDLDLSTCPLCRRGSLRIIAAIAHEAVITRILRHLKLAAVPPPIAPARARQETFDWVAGQTLPLSGDLFTLALDSTPEEGMA